MTTVHALRIAFLDTPDERDVPHILTDPEPVTVPTHRPDAKGNFGRVEYVASHARVATVEEVQRWRSE